MFNLYFFFSVLWTADSVLICGREIYSFCGISIWISDFMLLLLSAAFNFLLFVSSLTLHSCSKTFNCLILFNFNCLYQNFHPSSFKLRKENLKIM